MGKCLLPDSVRIKFLFMVSELTLLWSHVIPFTVSENGFTLAYLKWISYFGSCLRWMERKSATEMPDSNSGQGSANASPKK